MNQAMWMNLMGEVVCGRYGWVGY